MGGLKSRSLSRLTVKEGRITGEERLYAQQGQRIRDVRQGADGLIYLLTDGVDGKLIRLLPQP